MADIHVLLDELARLSAAHARASDDLLAMLVPLDGWAPASRSWTTPAAVNGLQHRASATIRELAAAHGALSRSVDRAMARYLELESG